jgi:hypothetical protein
MKTFIALLLFSSLSMADSINFGVLTDHSVSGDFNEDNRLVALEVNDYVFASFINSYNHQSYIIAKQIPFNGFFGVQVGASYGYDSKCFTKYCDSETNYNIGVNPFGSLYFKKSFGNIQITLIESIAYRTLTLGVLIN